MSSFGVSFSFQNSTFGLKGNLLGVYSLVRHLGRGGGMTVGCGGKRARDCRGGEAVA